MEWEGNKNEEETQEDSMNCDVQGNDRDRDARDNRDVREMKDDNKDVETQDTRNDRIVHENKNDGVAQEDNKNNEVVQDDIGHETLKRKSGGDKQDDEKGAGKEEAFENESRKLEDSEKDVQTSEKVESSEKDTSALLKPKRKLVEKSKVISRKKKPLAKAGKDGEIAANNSYAENSKQKQNSDEQSLEKNLQAETNDVKRKRMIEDKPPIKSTGTVEERKQKKKPRGDKGKDGEGCSKQMNSGEDSKQKIKSDEQPAAKKRLAEINEGEDTQTRTAGNESSIKKSNLPSLKNRGVVIKLKKGQKQQRKQEKHRKSRKVVKNRRNKTTHDERGKSLTNEITKDGHENRGKSRTNDARKERLGGFIFMCSGKTKPDCFHYRVMGVSNSKKDAVMGIRPGIKIFLFDFDLKLLYGIYKASSSGGVKLEPKAFGGDFPFQVRFDIDKDCFPLPESVFKKAIKDNYDKKNKFKTELTVRQVSKLTELFRPVNLRSLQPIHSPRRMTTRNSTQGVRANSHRDEPGRDCYGNADVMSYNMVSQDRDQSTLYRDAVLEQREEIPRDLFLTEKEYRAYGLRGERRNVTPPPLANPTLEIYHRQYERENNLEPIYKESVPARLGTRHGNAFYVNDKDYRTYGRISLARPDVPLHLNEEFQAYSPGDSGLHDLPSSVAAVGGRSFSSYMINPCYANRYGMSSTDPLLHSRRREEVASGSHGRMLIEADSLGRRETLEERLYSRDNLGRSESVRESLYPRDDLGRSEAIEDRLYSRYAIEASVDRNWTPHYHRTLHEAASVPVSSRYSFPGPSYAYR